MRIWSQTMEGRMAFFVIALFVVVGLIVVFSVSAKH
jgi:hypothetical protein